jgi:hypothetical protein
VWTGLGGVRQSLPEKPANLRKRSAAFPLQLPLRLIQMFSIAGNTVLDPLWGTGTTSVAASMLRRSSIGYEIDAAFGPIFDAQMDALGTLSKQYNQARIGRHQNSLRKRDAPCKNRNAFYDFGVVTQQECELVLYDVDAVRDNDAVTYGVT